MSELHVRHAEVCLARMPASLDGLMIAHVSDLHLSRWSPILEELQHRLLAFRSDFIAVTGDFCKVPRDARNAAVLTRRLFAPVAARRPVFAVLGNHDHPTLRHALAPELTVLTDESTILRTSRGHLRLSGVEQLRPRTGDLDSALSRHEHLPTVLLAHYPSIIHQIGGRRVDLQLSGHTHGGQVRLPRLGCIWSNDRIPARQAWGLSTIGGTALHVSAGVGLSPPVRVRWNCPPEITFLRVTAGATAALEAKLPADSAMGIDRKRRSA